MRASLTILTLFAFACGSHDAEDTDAGTASTSETSDTQTGTTGDTDTTDTDTTDTDTTDTDTDTTDTDTTDTDTLPDTHDGVYAGTLDVQFTFVFLYNPMGLPTQESCQIPVQFEVDELSAPQIVGQGICDLSLLGLGPTTVLGFSGDHTVDPSAEGVFEVIDPYMGSLLAADWSGAFNIDNFSGTSSGQVPSYGGDIQWDASFSADR